MSSESTETKDKVEIPPTLEIIAPGGQDNADASTDDSEDHFSDAQSDILSPLPKRSAPKESEDDGVGSEPPSEATVQPPTAGEESDVEISEKGVQEPVVKEEISKDEVKHEKIAEEAPVPDQTSKEDPADAPKAKETEKPIEVTESETVASDTPQTPSPSHTEATPEKQQDSPETTPVESQDEGTNVTEIQEALEEVKLDDTQVAPEQSSLPGGYPVPTTVVHPHEDSEPVVESFEKESSDIVMQSTEKPTSDSQLEAIEAPGTPVAPSSPLQPTIQISTDMTDVTASPSLGPPRSPLSPNSPLSPRSPRSARSASLSAPGSPRSPRSPRQRRRSSRHMQNPAAMSLEPPMDDDFDDFGDFDDFEEGGDGDSFGSFGDVSFQAPEAVATPNPMPPASPAMPVTPMLPFPIPDFEGLSEEEFPERLETYMNLLYPAELTATTELPALPKENTSFLTPRSASLWTQLVAPPPLAPPDWIRSRIRRLFLVSLGVPVDLDEILPASKQKKLVLPSLDSSTDKSPRGSSDVRGEKKEGAVSEGVGESGKKKEKVKGAVDLVAAKQLCGKTQEALLGMTEEELLEHKARLAALQIQVQEAIVHWTNCKGEKVKEKEALEGVIENLVKHAQKVRK